MLETHSCRSGPGELRPGPLVSRTVPDLREYGQEAYFLSSDGLYELFLVENEVPDSVVQAVREGDAEFALWADESLILLCYRFGDAIPWSIAPLGWQPAPRTVRGGGPAMAWDPGEVRALLCTALVEARDQTIRARRNMTLSLEFSRLLDASIRDWSRIPYDPRAQKRALAALRRRYPTPASLVSRARARTIGSL